MSDDDLGAAVPLDGDRLDALRADVFAEVSLATGWDDSVDELVDVKNELTAAVMQLVVVALRASWAEIERLNGIVEALENDADQAITDKAEAVEAESQAGDRFRAERDEARAALASAQRTLAERGARALRDGTEAARGMRALIGSDARASRPGAADKENDPAPGLEVLADAPTVIAGKENAPAAAEGESDR